MQLVKKIFKKYRKTLLLIFLAGGVIYWLSEKVNTRDVIFLVEKAGIFGPLVYILLQALTLIIAPISGSPVLLAGYVAFGKEVQIYTYLAAVFAGTVDFLIAKKWGRRIVVKMVGKNNMEKVDGFTKDYGLKMLIILRLLQGQFFDFISYAFGLTEMKFRPYFVITVLFPLPWTLLWYFYLFNHVGSLLEYTTLLAVLYIPFWIVSGFLYARFRKKRKSLNP